MSPKDFAPYRSEIELCECKLCREVAYAASDVLDFNGQRHAEAARRLLEALCNRQHARMTLHERAAEARAEKARRLAIMRHEGASPAQIEAVERGYVTVKMSDLYASGAGIGIGTPPGI